MAERRMFAKTIIDSDAFLDMPVSARLLYYDLGMRADDDGFVNAPKKIMRMIGASNDDMNILIARKFIIPFDSGIVVIKHWRINNYLRNDRYKETTYIEEKSKLETDQNGSYHLKTSGADTLGIPHGIPTVSPGKDRLGKDSIGEDREGRAERFTPPTLDEVRAYVGERGNKIDPEAFMAFYESNGWKVGKVGMKNWKAAVITWERREKKANEPKTPKGTFYQFEQRTYTEEEEKEIEKKLLRKGRNR